MKKNQSNRIIQQSMNLQAQSLNHPINNRSALTNHQNINSNSSNAAASKVVQSQELLPKFYQQNGNNIISAGGASNHNNSNSLRQSKNLKTKENSAELIDSNLIPFNQQSHGHGDGSSNNRYSIGTQAANTLTTAQNSHSQQIAGLNPAKSHANIGGGIQASNTGPVNSKSIDAASMKQNNRRLVSSGQKNMRQNVQSKHQRGSGQPLSQANRASNQTQSVQHSQANLSTGGALVKYNVKNGNFTFKAAGKNLAGSSAAARSDSRKIESNRVASSSNRNQMSGGQVASSTNFSGGVSSSVQVQSVRQLAGGMTNSNHSTKASASNIITTKRSYVGNSSNSAQVTGGRKMSHSQQNTEMFHSMGSEQYQQKMLSAGGQHEDSNPQLKTTTLINNNANDLGPLDISGGAFTKELGLRKDDRNKQMLALNKKLIKPLTGNKQSNQSQQSLVFPSPQINSLLAGSSEAVLADSSRPDDLVDQSDKSPNLNFLSTGSQQHQSQKIRIPKHALANVNNRNKVDMSQKGSFVSQRSAQNNQTNKSTSQQKHAKKNNQQFQQLHGVGGGSNSHSSRFGSSGNNGQGIHSQSLNPISATAQLNLNQKLKSTANRENLTNADRRPMLNAITKPRFAQSHFDGPNNQSQHSNQVNATEQTLQPGHQQPPLPTHKNLTINNNSEKKFVSSERISFERPNQQVSDSAKRDSKEGFNTNTHKSEARSQSRTIGQFIPAQVSSSMTNMQFQAQNQHLQMSGTQQRAHVLKQSKSNITSKTIGMLQQRMLKTASNGDNTTENILKQAQYISSQKQSGQQMFLQNVVKVNPLINATNNTTNGDTAVNLSQPLNGLPPMNSGGSSQGPKSFVRSRGASSGTIGNILSSKNIAMDGKNNLQLTPQTGVEDSKKKLTTAKQRKTSSILSPDQATDVSPYNEGKINHTTGKRDTEKKSLAAQDKSPMQQQFQSTPNSNNTTHVMLGSREQGVNPNNNDSIGNNHTYRSENLKMTGDTFSASKNKVQKKLNTLLNQASALQSDDQQEALQQNQHQSAANQAGTSQSRTPKVQSEKHKRMAASNSGVVQPRHTQNALSASQENLGHLILPMQANSSASQQLQGSHKSVVIPSGSLLSADQDRERNDTIPEEPTISMDEFQSNQASFCANQAHDPGQAFSGGANKKGQMKSDNSQKAQQEQIDSRQQHQQPQYNDSESIQKQQDGERDAAKKKPEEPAGPASIKGLNRRREHKLLQSQNLVQTGKPGGNSHSNELFGNMSGAKGTANSMEIAGLASLTQSQSTDKLKHASNKRGGIKILPSGDTDDDQAQSQSHQQLMTPQQRQMMVKLSDRLSQNPVKQQLSSEKQHRRQAGLQSNSQAAADANTKDRSKNKISETPNKDQDDRDFDDCDQDGQAVADENPKIDQVNKSVGINPKSQLHNSIAQRANRNQQLDQPGGDKRAFSQDSGPSRLGGTSNEKPQSSTQRNNQIASISSNPNHQASSSARPIGAAQSQSQPPPQVPQSIRKVEDHVAQFAYLTRPGKTADGVSKTNQDNFFVVKNFAKIENLWYFGVCDGHGQNGHYVSEYVKNKLALDIMEVDIAMKDHQASRMAKNKLAQFDAQDNGGKDNNSFENQEAQLQHSGSDFYKRKQSHDGSHTANNEFGDSKGKLSKKRKSQDDKAVELAKLKSQYMKQITSNLLTDGPKLIKVFTDGFRNNDRNLKHQGFGYEFSGTTIVTAMVQGNRIVTANAGDSRAVIGSLRSRHYQIQDAEIESRALSIEANEMAWFSKMITRDHKPDDPDEMARIQSMNGRIESYKGRYGENVGPARVWLKNEQYPGLAMSRSIGDACAHSVGVSAIPEIKEFQTNDEDKFMIMASDGVWEFLSNDEVIDLIVPFWHKNDLKGACSTVVKESVAAWEREEDSIDDITCIIVFFKRSGPIHDYSQTRSSETNTREKNRGGTRESSSNNANNTNNGGTDSSSKHGKGSQYQHKGRHLKKSKDNANGSKK